MKTKLFICFLMLIFTININPNSVSAQNKGLQTESRIYLPLVFKPWTPELWSPTPPGGNPETCNSVNRVFLAWTIREDNGIPFYDSFRVEESLDNVNWVNIYETDTNIAVFNNAMPWGFHFYRVYGIKSDERSGYSNILPVEIFWRHGYNDLQIWGDVNGGVVNVSLPVRESYARIYFGAVPGATIDLPPGSVYYDEWFWYLDFLPGEEADFSTTWAKQDCSGYLNCLYFSALSSPWQRLDEITPPYCMGQRGWP